MKKIGENKVLFQEICHYFGLMKNKNGWLYEDTCDVEVVVNIKDLWWRMYDQNHIMNKQLPVHFGRELVAGYKGKSIKWAEYAASTNLYREQVRSTKAANLENKRKENISLAVGRSGPPRRLSLHFTASSALEESKPIMSMVDPKGYTHPMSMKLEGAPSLQIPPKSRKCLPSTSSCVLPD